MNTKKYPFGEDAHYMYRHAPCDSGILYAVLLSDDEVTRVVMFHFGECGELQSKGKEADYYTIPEHVYQELIRGIYK